MAEGGARKARMRYMGLGLWGMGLGGGALRRVL